MKSMPLCVLEKKILNKLLLSVLGLAAFISFRASAEEKYECSASFTESRTEVRSTAPGGNFISEQLDARANEPSLQNAVTGKEDLVLEPYAYLPTLEKAVDLPVTEQSLPGLSAHYTIHLKLTRDRHDPEKYDASTGLTVVSPTEPGKPEYYTGSTGEELRVNGDPSPKFHGIVKGIQIGGKEIEVNYAISCRKHSYFGPMDRSDPYNGDK